MFRSGSLRLSLRRPLVRGRAPLPAHPLAFLAPCGVRETLRQHLKRSMVAALPSVVLLLVADPALAGGPPEPSPGPTPLPPSTVACSAAALIRAINKANTAAGGQLNLAPRCVYTLPRARPGTKDGLPPIRKPITINGAGATITRSAARGTADFRIAEVLPQAKLSILSLTISNGRAPGPASDGGGAIEVREGAALSANMTTVTGNVGSLGGGIHNLGTTQIVNSAITHNQGWRGGGVSNSTPSGALAITNTLVSENGVAGDASMGGGVRNQGGGSATLLNTAVISNTAQGLGAGIFNDHDSTMSITNTAVLQNLVGRLRAPSRLVAGGGIENLGKMAVRTTAVERNRAERTGPLVVARGGGISNEVSGDTGASPPTLTMVFSKVANNVADDAPGGFYNNRGTVGLNEVTIAGKTQTNCAGSPTAMPGCSEVDIR